MIAGRREFIGAMLGGLPLAAQQAGQPYVPKQSDRPEPPSGEEAGFRSIFDGKSLDGWEGDPKYWRAADGVMIGEITPQTVIKSNTFIIWRGGTPGNFELKVDVRITAAGNTGINYRSKVVPDKVTPENKFAMKGYQCDIDGQNRYTGNNYEEKGRLFLAVRGQVTRITRTRKPTILATIADEKEVAAAVTNDWNSVHITARGTVLMHKVNGRLMCVVIDDDVANRAMDGLIGVQVHVGGPMKVESIQPAYQDGHCMKASILCLTAM